LLFPCGGRAAQDLAVVIIDGGQESFPRTQHAESYRGAVGRVALQGRQPESHFGGEKTFLDGDASIELRLPLNTLSADSGSGLGGTNTDIGDLTIVGKYAFWRDRQSGDLLSAGLAVTAPTGPDNFANSHIQTFHSTLLQPFVGYIWNLDKWFVQGFTAIE